MTLRLVSDLVPYWAKTTPDAIALSDPNRRWTYAELDSAIRDAAEMLAQAGGRQGDRVLLICENGSAAVLLYFACTVVGAWPVILNARLSEREIEEIRGHCRPRLSLFTTDASIHALRHAQKARATAVEMPGLTGVMFGPADQDAPRELAESDRQDDVAALIYTSGTTGTPKGVMLSHANLLFAATGGAKVRRMNESDCMLSVLPISHILGLSGVLLGSFASGAEVQLLARFDPATLLDRLAKGGTTVMIGTPAMYSMLAEYAARKNISRFLAPRLRIVSTAGAPLDRATKEKTEALFGQPLRNGYGITECSPTITLGDIDAPASDLSVGKPLPGIEIRIVSASGDVAAAGEVGELWVRGPGVMKGYYSAPEETALAIDAEGWFKTGDLARMSEGSISIVGRSKEMLIRFGFNVYPAEIEAVLNGHPKVARAAAVGSGADGEGIAVFVQLKTGETLRSGELAEYAGQQLAPYKRPSRYILVDALPLTPAGKVLRGALASQLVHAS